MGLIKLIFSGTLLAAASTVNAANVQVYYDQTEWANAVAAAGRTIVTEDFEDTTLNCALSVVTSAGHVDTVLGNWSDTLNSRNHRSSWFHLRSPVYAVGGYWNIPAYRLWILKLSLSNQEDGVDLYSIEFKDPVNGGFVGFVSYQPFDIIKSTFGYNFSSTQEILFGYLLDNFQYAEAGSVSIQNKDCGVANAMIPSSNQTCTVQDYVSSSVSNCSEGAKNHGQFVGCFTRNMNALKKEGVLTDGDKGALTSCAAQAKISQKQN